MTSEYKSRLEEDKALIEEELARTLALGDDYKVAEAMRYSTLGGGKRIRGVLTLEFCRALKGDVKRALPAAAAIEMIHAFSLVHDDLPCMDDDDIRREKPSCHKRFGESTALLSGDALLTAAFNTVATSSFLPKGEALSPKNVVSIISVLSSSTLEMIKGQQYDMEFEKRKVCEITADDLLSMYSRKTSALISGACVCGAICANASDKSLHNARGYGYALGLVFQITDDIIDLDTEKEDKKTLPLIIGKEKSLKTAKEYTDIAIKSAENLPDGNFLKELVSSLIGRGV